EAGDHELTPDDFRKKTDQAIAFEDEAQVAAIDFHVPGEYPVDLKSGLFHYHAKLTVQDTVAPAAEGISLEIGLGDTVEATQLVANVEDETALHISFMEEPDFGKLGRQPLQIRLMDMGGNYTTVDSELVVIPIYPELVREAGDPVPTVIEFLLDNVDAEQANAVQILTDLSTIDMHTVGTTELEFSMGDYLFTGNLVVEDTFAPEVEAEASLERYINQQIEPEEFITGYTDQTSVEFSFVSEPDMTKEGYQDLEIMAVDEAGNSTTVATKLMLVKDTEPPVISGANDLTFYVEDSISYRSGITLSDNCDKPEDIKLEINTDQVVSGTAGTYKVVYTATDLSGNTAEKTVNLTLISKSYDEATVNALAQQVLAKIITPGMSEYDKIVAIYNWVTGNVRYAEQPNMTDWLKAAYDGLAQHKGDCYVYCMTSKALLDNAGIKNMVIDTVPLRYIHFWNLVDIGEGWHHFDCTPRRAGGVFLYWTDAQIKEYSDAHNNSHIYDKTRFPDIP
ncbi:MAG: transglutaminase domain-containing protein, partial [Lachnospiraceae bacterium]|nr:transglutaminase domain-containing protein [Lachnospiraceae bacterium]